MALFSIITVGDETLVAGLAAFNVRALGAAPLAAWMEVVRDDMERYPPERPGQIYARTGNLGAAWRNAPAKIAGTAWGLSGELVNPTSYGVWVQRDERQGGPAQNRAYHKGRWQTDEQVVERRADDLAEALTVAIEAYWLLVP